MKPLMLFLLLGLSPRVAVGNETYLPIPACDAFQFGNKLPFAKRTGQLWGESFEYFFLIGDLPYHKRTIQDLFLNANRDLFVGFLEGHVYVAFDGARLDGGSLTHLSRNTVRDHSHLSSGLIVRVRNLPQVTIENLKIQLSAKKQSLPLTCATGVCSFVRKSGVNTPGTINVLPRQYLKNLMTGVVRDYEGNILKTEVILLSGLPKYDSIEHFYSLMEENWEGGGISD